MIRLLRGRVVIREDMAADHAHLKHIIVPGVVADDHPTAAARRRTWHRGTVLAMGAPALTRTRACKACHGAGEYGAGVSDQFLERCASCYGTGRAGGAEIPHGFAVGDEVIFHWAHLETAWTVEWEDGKLAACVPQECVDAVIG